MSKHTDEPWAIGQCGEATLIVRDGDDPVFCSSFIAATAMPNKAFAVNSDANAARIVECVNAFAGIDKPAAFVAAVRGLVASYDGSESMWGRTPTINWERVELIAAMLKGDSNV